MRIASLSAPLNSPVCCTMQYLFCVTGNSSSHLLPGLKIQQQTIGAQNSHFRKLLSVEAKANLSNPAMLPRLTSLASMLHNVPKFRVSVLMFLRRKQEHIINAEALEKSSPTKRIRCETTQSDVRLTAVKRHRSASDR